MRGRGFIVGAACVVLGCLGCGETELDPFLGRSVGGSGSASSVAPGGGSPGPSQMASSSAATGDGGGQTCNGVVVETKQRVRSIDAIFVVDNSASMVEEVEALEQHLHPSFAYVLGAAGIDAQVILVTDHGAGPTEVCIGAPLAGPNVECSGQPGFVAERFGHYSVAVGDHDGLCLLLDSFRGTQDGDAADEFGLHDEGWRPWLRPDAHKVIVAMTDDRLDCSWRGEVFDDGEDPTVTPMTSQAAAAAADWDRQLLQRASFHFGSVAQRNYQFFSFIGLGEPQSPDPVHEGFGAEQGLVTSQCLGATSPGFGYQWLSRATGARRYSSCSDPIYGAMFLNLVTNVIDGATDRCSLVVTEPKPYDDEALEVEFSPSEHSERERYLQVAGPADCAGGEGFYLDGDTVRLCDATCERVRADADGSLTLIAQCPKVP